MERFFHAELNGDHKAEDDDENNETTTAVNNQKSPNSQNFDKKELQPEPNITPTLTTANSVVESAAAPKEKTIEIEENNKNEEVPENSVKTHENSCVNNDKEMDTDEDDKPLARRRRSLIKVVQPTVSSQNLKKKCNFTKKNYKLLFIIIFFCSALFIRQNTSITIITQNDLLQCCCADLHESFTTRFTFACTCDLHEHQYATCVGVLFFVKLKN